jgi:catalase
MEDKVRGKPEKFADHFTQARLFFASQTPTEKNHIVGAFRFELTKVGVQAVRERVISMLANVSAELAQGVADGLGIAVPPAQPRVLETPATPEVTTSPALSLMARPGDGSVKTRRVALLVADGIDGASLRAVHAALAAAGAVPRFVGARLGSVRPGAGAPIHVEVTMETAPSVLWDGVVVPGGDGGLAGLGQAVDFVKDQYRHCKTILVLGAKSALVERASLPATLPDGGDDPGLVMARSGDTAPAFIAALARHRHYERETDPPAV